MELSSRDRRALIILGVVVVVAAVVGVLLLGGGDGEPEAPTAPTQGTPSPAVPPLPDDEEEPPPAFTFFGGRDPFEPLIVVAPPSADGTTDGTDGTTDGDADGGTGDGGRRESITVGGHDVTLIDIFTENGTEKAQVRVDGEVHVVREGGTFAGEFKLVSVQGGCANFLFGDQAFTLCEPGERK